MSRAFLTAIVATLAMGSFAPQLAAQDTTSATGRVRPDTSAYTGTGGVDTMQQPGRVGADTSMGGVTDSGSVLDSIQRTDTTRLKSNTNGIGPAPDTSGMNGRQSADSITPGETRNPGGTSTSGTSPGAAGATPPSSQPRQPTSPSSQSPSGP